MRRETIKCQFCGNIIERLYYKSMSKLWFGVMACKRCHYKWEVKQANGFVEMLDRLSTGGDWDRDALLPTGMIIKWATNRFVKINGVQVHKKYPKKGKIVGHIEPGVNAIDHLLNKDPHINISRIKIKKISHKRRYIVEVQRVGKKGNPLESWFLSPLATTIEAENPYDSLAKRKMFKVVK